MLRSVASKVMWVGRTASAVFGLALVLALVVGAASAALGATGGTFILGKNNGADSVSRLTADVAGPALNLINDGTHPAATALNLHVDPSRAPMKVNSSTKVARLNADRLDGKSEEDFYPAGSKVSDSDSLDGKDSSEFLSANGKAQDASHADQATNAQNADDADTLDGNDSSVFLRNDFRRSSTSFPSSTSSGTRVCGTAAYTPAYPQTALVDINVSLGAPSTASVTDVFLRGSVTSDSGANWNSTDQTSPEIDVAAGSKSALGYAGTYPLEPGVTYNFAAQVNYSGTSGSTGGICQVLVTFINRSSSG